MASTNTPQNFFNYFSDHLAAQGLMPSTLDPCLFVGKSMVVVVYVDDLLIYAKLSLRRMRVTWFCFIAHIFSEEKVPTERINILVIILQKILDSWIKEPCKSIYRWGSILQENMSR